MSLQLCMKMCKLTIISSALYVRDCDQTLNVTARYILKVFSLYHLIVSIQSRSGKKWSHLECPECTHLRNSILKATLAAKKTANKTAAELDQLLQKKQSLEEKLDQHFTVVQGSHVRQFKCIISCRILLIFCLESLCQNYTQSNCE